MPIGEICNRAVIFVKKDTNLLEVAQLMRQNHVGDLVIVDEKNGRRVPVGIVTDRDIVIEVIAKELDISALTAGDVMGPGLATVRETEGVFETIQLMRLKGVRRMPIIDAHGGLAGIISIDDLIELLAEEMNELAKLISREQVRETKTRK